MATDFQKHFKVTQMVHVATCMDAQPHLRPMTLIVHEGRYYFATGAGDSKSAELDANPRAEFCLLIKQDAYTGYIRAAGEMRKVEDLALKTAVADASGFIYDYFNNPADPDFRLYELVPSRVRYMLPGEMLDTVIEM